MRITGRQLRQIIKEEVARMMNEADSSTIQSDVMTVLERLEATAGTKAARNYEGVTSDINALTSGSSSPKLTATVKALVASTTDDILVGFKFVARVAGVPGEVTARGTVLSDTEYSLNGKYISSGKSGMTPAGTGQYKYEFEACADRIGAALRAAV